MEQLGVEVDACVHRDVLHVLQAADDLHVFEAGHDGVRGLVDGLQARAAQAVDRRAAGVRRQPGHQADDAGDVEPLLALLLRVAQHDVFDLGRIDAGALDERLRPPATARSSERTSRKTPLSLWARPIGVRTQSTMTARFIGRVSRGSAGSRTLVRQSSVVRRYAAGVSRICSTAMQLRVRS